MTRCLPNSLKGSAWLESKPLQALLKVLGADEGQARIAGGAVRDALLGQDVQDIDIATQHTPGEVTALAEQAGFTVHPTGIEHGTVTVVVHDKAGPHPFEVTTLRIDTETYGRHAAVQFTADWTADASRRDFTINALYCDANGEIHDPLDGLDDLTRGRIRFAGDAVTRIREDYLRILRFFRFHARFGRGDPDQDGLAACARERGGLRQLSAERISDELIKTLLAPRAVHAFNMMHDTGILKMVLTPTPDLQRLERMIDIDQANRLAGDGVLRFAALAGPDAALGERLRLSNAENKRLHTIAAAPDLSPGQPAGAHKRHLYVLKADAFRDVVRWQWAASTAEPDDTAWAELLYLPQTWAVPKFPVSGADLLAHGYQPGPDLGRKLKALEDQWIAGGFAADKSEILSDVASRGDRAATRE